MCNFLNIDDCIKSMQFAKKKVYDKDVLRLIHFS